MRGAYTKTLCIQKNMIRKLDAAEYERLFSFASVDPARNYFILLGLISPKPVFQEVYAQFDSSEVIQAALFYRHSGNIQFYSRDSFEISGFSSVIKRLDFGKLIGPASYCDKFIDKDLFAAVEEGAILAALTDMKKQYDFDDHHQVQALHISDLDEVESLYSSIFESYSKKSVMAEKLKSGRGRGVVIRKNGIIVSVAQSEFEMRGSALIVGVATRPGYRSKSLATQCLESLCKELMKEGKKLFLQYDNHEAGKIYERLGFVPFDQIKHYKSR